MAEKKRADIHDVLATYSEHVKENYPEPETFRENLGSLLAAKRKRMSLNAYLISLERNIVFLHDLSIEGEALLEVVLGGLNDEGTLSGGAEGLLAGMEEKVRTSTAERHKRIFLEGEGGEFTGLVKLRPEGGEKYAEQLEFQYNYLMTFRMLLFEFFNLLAAVSAEYFVDRIDEAAPGHVMSSIEMTANYYLGNISVGEVIEDKGEPST